jgi:hypothetical protein
MFRAALTIDNETHFCSPGSEVNRQNKEYKSETLMPSSTCNNFDREPKNTA